MTTPTMAPPYKTGKKRDTPFDEFAMYKEKKPSNASGGKKARAGEEARRAAKNAPETAAEAAIFTGVGCTLSMLDYSIPPKQVDIEKPLFETKISSSIMPQDAEGSILFHCEPSGGNVCISLFDSVFSFKCQVVHDDLTNLDETEQISIIPYALNTQFRRVQIEINGQTLTSSTSSNHHYESFLSALANLSDSTKKFQLSSGMWYPDVEADAGSIANWTSLPNNSNFKTRSNYIARSQKFELIGRLLTEVFLVPKLWPPFTEISINLTLAPTNFIVIAKSDKKYRYRVLEAKLHLAKFVLTETALQRQYQLLHSRGLDFLYPKWDTRVITVQAGAQSVEQEISRGATPDRMMICLLSQAAYVENRVDLNCLHLTPHNLQSLQLFLNGEPRPWMPFQIDTDPLTGAVHADAAYFLLMKESNLINQSLSISLSDFQSAMFYLCIDLSRDHSSGMRQSYFSRSPDSTLVCKIKFHKALTSAVNILFVHEYDAILKLSGDRRISCTV